MSIEQQVRDALLDLEGALTDGTESEAAIAEVSRTYGLKPEVLRARGAALLINPVEVRARADAAKQLYGHLNALENVVREFRELTRKGADPSIEALLEANRHHDFTEDEKQYAFNQSMDIWLSSQLNKILEARE